MEDMVDTGPAALCNFFLRKRVLITGHTGFKGAWLSLWLLKMGASVVGYALPPPTNPSLFDLCRLQDGMESISGDVRNYDYLKATVHKYKPEIIFHMAAQALVRRSYTQPVETYGTNIMGTVNILDACRASPYVRSVVIVTSDKCYANSLLHSAHNENDPLGGYDPYSSSKGCAELVAASYRDSFFNKNNYGKQHAVAIATARAGNVIGGGDWAEDRLIPDCIRAIAARETIKIRYPEALRPWQHVFEPLYGYCILAKRLYEDGPDFGEAWNFGPDEVNAKPVRLIVEEVTRLWGLDAAWSAETGEKAYESGYLQLNCAKAKKRLGWNPRWDLSTTLAKTVDWYKSYLSQGEVLDITLKQLDDYNLATAGGELAA